ncbi:MAG: hypothetical protein M1825_005830 [Sarcosagium campestre]|nr:MAG: hypothetical protein M1825_005830 [Sarcosagium campestre]
MSSPAPRRSNDSAVSPFSSPRPNQYPFPYRDASPRPGLSSTLGHSRGSRTASISSIGGTLDVHAPKDPLRESGQNAISTLLQPPIVRTGLVPHTALPASSAHKPPTSRDIPPVTLTNIPHVDPSEFRQYLSQIGSLYDAFQRAKDDNDNAASSISRRDRLKPSDRRVISQTTSGSGTRNHVESAPSSPLDAPASPSRPGGTTGRRLQHAPTPLSTIPSVYFDSDFHLENPRTFDVVSERSDVVRPVQGKLSDGGRGSETLKTFPAANTRKSLATNAILQEKLSWYMDTVEVHLISSISTASTSFFAALGSLRVLHSEAAESVEKIRKLRADLARLDNDMAVAGLKIVSTRQRRENLRKLGDAVDQLRNVVVEVSKCETMVEAGEVERALDGIERVERLMAGEEDETGTETEMTIVNQQQSLYDLRGIKALNGATKDLDLLRMRCGKIFEDRFLAVLVQDLRRHIASVPTSDTLRRWNSASSRGRGDHNRTPSAFPAYLNIDRDLRGDLLSNLNGLGRSNYAIAATASYSETVLREIKNLIRKHLPSSDDDDNESMASVSTRGGRQLSQQEKSSILARNLRALEPEAAEELFAKVYSGISEFLRRLGVQVKVLLDVTSGISSPPVSAGMKSPPRSPNPQTLDGYLSSKAPIAAPSPGKIQEDMHQALDMSSLLGRAVDIAQAQMTKIIKVRAEQTSRLSVARFLRYFTLNRLFADECEAVSGRGGIALKNVVNGHIKDFVSHLGDLERQSLARMMESDQWDAKDFGDKETALLGRISQGSASNVGSWVKATRVWEDYSSDDEHGLNGVAVNGTSGASGRDRIRSAVVDEQKFILPSSAITVLYGIEKFEHLMSGIPSMTQEVSQQLLDYLKLFNSRSCQLILGAGATRSAGLKNITTKHLALASQALSFIIALIPHVRELVRRQQAAAAGGLMTEFDKVKSLYQDHQGEIHEKLVGIMSGRATVHVGSMRKIKWDEVAKDSPQVNAYMETLTKETNTLHRVLSKHLDQGTVQAIMDPVFESYRKQWGKAFQEAEVVTPEGHQRMIRDAELFKSRLSKLEGGAETGQHIYDLVQARAIGESEAEAEAEATPKAATSGDGDVNGDNDVSSRPSEKVNGVETNVATSAANTTTTDNVTTTPDKSPKGTSEEKKG